MPEEKYDIRRELVAVCHRLEEKGFVTAAEGNVTARMGNGNILCTRRGINKGRVTEDDLIEVTPHGELLTNRHQPSTELKMHLFIYDQRPDVKAVVHAHPVYATGFATARIPLTDCVLPEIVVGLGSIPLAEYATPSTDEVAVSLSLYIRGRDAVLLANHGVVTIGGDLWDAYWKMEQVERAAQVTFIAHLLGGEKPLTGKQIEKLRAAYTETYGKDIPFTMHDQPGESQRPHIGTGEMDRRFRELLKNILQGSQ